MYSTVKKESATSRTQIESNALTIETESESICLKGFYPELDSQFTQVRDLFSDRSFERAENSRDFSQQANRGEVVSIENNLMQLKQEITQLEISVSQATQERLETQEMRFERGMNNLQSQAEHINDLAALLEKEMLKFKTMARKVNQDYHAIQDSHSQVERNFSNYTSSQPYRTRRTNVWEIRSSAIPTVVKQGHQFILTSKQVLEVAEDNPENRAKKAQQRQKALECWLEAKRQRIIDNFSRP